tara:strand:- start:1045 stop:1179 length:135 start_codon:yes stop_codon:yes gene_type:complete
MTKRGKGEASQRFSLEISPNDLTNFINEKSPAIAGLEVNRIVLV